MLVDYQMERQSPDKKMFVAANTTVPLHKRYIVVSPPNDTSTVTVTLPNVSEAEGRKFIVSAASVPADGATRGMVLVNYTNGGASNLTTSITTTGVEISFESDGINWHVVRGA